MTDAGDEAARRADSARRAVVAVWRIEAAKIVAVLTRYTGDFALAEDLAQEALAEALEQWPERGVPRNGAAWLTQVGKRRAIDHWRRQERYADRIAALRLARILAALQPDEPEVHGLLALLELTAARFPARVDAQGEPVLLADQDRSRWDLGAIRRGRAALRRAEGFGRGLGAYGLRAAIAECHAVAPRVEATDWRRIVAAYEGLERLRPSPVVALNRAVALSMAEGPDAGPEAALAIVDGLAGERVLAASHLLPSVRGELLARLGRDEEAAAAFADAAERTRNARERAVLLARAAGARG
ncbi:hypothetical protein LG314_11260 [Agrococcus terreus]|uniref:DUF6596 domain-containing protein n=1 Tax=Agrococcus terreus TaxID=574649 RepID=UPI00384FF5F8